MTGTKKVQISGKNDIVPPEKMSMLVILTFLIMCKLSELNRICFLYQ